MTIYDRLKESVTEQDSTFVMVHRNDLSNALEALAAARDMFDESCGCINTPRAFKNVMARKIKDENEG